MMLDLIKKNRSCRRFKESKHISEETLLGLVNLGRLSASAANKQPLCYILSNEPEKNAKIFATVAWAGYLKDWSGPKQGERPAAYIVILADKNISKNVNCDHGIAAQSITLGAAEIGISACMMTAINHSKLRSALDIPDQFEILMVIAIGECAENICLEDLGPDEKIEYWRDTEDVHHVPKRSLEDLILPF